MNTRRARTREIRPDLLAENGEKSLDGCGNGTGRNHDTRINIGANEAGLGRKLGNFLQLKKPNVLSLQLVARVFFDSRILGKMRPTAEELLIRLKIVT